MSEEKKIIVDEDWKSQVAAEKSAVGQEQRGGAARDDSPSMPEASFEMLVSMFVTEAMVGLGQLPHPLSGKMEPEVAHARYAIDMLEVISEKTKGNLAPAEEQGLEQLLHQLRMAFVSVSTRPAAASPAKDSPIIQPGS